VIGTAVASAAMTLLQGWYLRGQLGGFEGLRTVAAIARMTACAAVLGGVSYGVWAGLDSALGRSLPAQLVSVGAAIVAGTAVYAAAVSALRIPEAGQIRALVAGRLRPGPM
jgi:putative peptidoglycan lipid II flippase